MKRKVEAGEPLEILLFQNDSSDQPLMLKFLSELSVQNHVYLAPEWRDALEYLGRAKGFEKAPRPDLIVLDLSASPLGGPEIMIAIKAQPGLALVPVIVLCRPYAPQEILAAYQSKTVYYLIKPATIPQFELFRKYLEEVWLKPLRGLKAHPPQAPSGPIPEMN